MQKGIALVRTDICAMKVLNIHYTQKISFEGRFLKII